MERSDSLIKLVAVIVFIAFMAYLGVSFISGYRDPLRTVTATGMELRDGLTTTGFFVREEETVTATGSNIAVTATEGAKLAAGETIAVRYVGSTAMERARQISEIQLRIRQLTALKNGESADQLSDRTILELSRLLASGKLTKLYDIEQDIDAYIISGTALASGHEAEEIAALEEQLRSLAQDSSADTARVTAPFSGTFSFAVDGYENVRPDELLSLTPSGFDSLFLAPSGTDPSTVGKLIRGTRWYYVCLMDEASANKLRGLTTAKLSFSRTYSGELTMRIDYLSAAEDGRCVAVFSTDKYMQDTAAVREATAEIIFGVRTGVSIPRQAVHLDENGGSIVYVLRGVTAHEVKVNIIAESGDFYMAEDTGDGIRANDIIIIRAANLYDGAVVER